MKTILLIVLCFCLFPCDASVLNDSIQPQGHVNSDGYIYFLDGNAVDKQYILYHQDSIGCSAGFETTRDAIFLSNGMYQAPAVICYSLNKNKNLRMYHINGKISEEYNGEYVRLYKMQGDTLLLSMDVAKVEDGKFYFEGNESNKDFALLMVGYGKEKVLTAEAVLEAGDIEISLDTISCVQGTYYNDLYDSICSKANKAVARMFGTHETIAEADSLANCAYALICNLMKENCTNVAGQKFIKEYKQDLHVEYDLILDVYNHIEKSYQNNSWLTRKELQIIKRIKEANEKSKQLLQSRYIDIELVTPEGEAKHLSEYVGKSDYLFVDFWASWCAPCRDEIPDIKNVYEAYNSKGLEVINISLDTVKKQWLTSLDKLDMPWRQFVLPKNSGVQKLYGFSTIPYNVLIDRMGTIMMVNVKAYQLEQILSKLEEFKK